MKSQRDRQTKGQKDKDANKQRDKILSEGGAFDDERGLEPIYDISKIVSQYFRFLSMAQ